MTQEMIRGRDSPSMETGPPENMERGRLMEREQIINNICHQMMQVGYMIQDLTENMKEIKDGDQQVYDHYDEIMLNEVNHMQILTLELTRVAAGSETNADDSAFAEGAGGEFCKSRV